MPKQATARRRRISKSPEVRREELLRAASVLFENKGVTATSIGDITGSIHVARGTFYLYFTSKDDVVAELWRRYVAGFLSETENNERDGRRGCDSDPVLDFLEHLAHHALRHAALHRIVYGTADAAAIALCKQSDEAILARLTDLTKAHLLKEQRKDRDADLLASLIFQGLDGALHRAIMPGVPIDEAMFVGEVKRFAAGALGLAVQRGDSRRK